MLSCATGDIGPSLRSLIDADDPKRAWLPSAAMTSMPTI